MSNCRNPDETALIKAAEKLMIEVMSRYDPSHDVHHVQRVRKTALSLASIMTSDACQPDLLVVELAALLHDVLDKKYVTPEEAADPYSYFLPFFQKHATENLNLVKDGRAREITKIVSNVSWSTEKKLRETGQWGAWHDNSCELHVVQDADRLDAIGAFGVLRCAAYSARVNRPLHIPPNGDPDPESAIGHFHEKLLHIKDKLKTPPGRMMGERRHQVLLNFLQEIDDEYNAALPAS